MIIAFLHARQSPEFAENMVASVRRHMPDTRIVQLTDEDTPAIVDDVQRLPWDDRVMLWRMQHLALLAAPEVLVLDTDVVVQADVRDVFQKRFDAALTRRDGPILDPNGVDVAKLMPYNCGVMFARGRAFWDACVALMQTMPDEVCKWYGDQIAVKHLAPKFNTLELPCDVYNYTPSSKTEDVSGRKIVHYKGIRKKWLSLTTPR